MEIFYCHHMITKTLKLTDENHKKKDKRDSYEQTVKVSQLCNTPMMQFGNYYWCTREAGGCGLMWSRQVILDLHRTHPSDPVDFTRKGSP